MSARSLSGVSCIGQNENKKEQKWEANKNLSIANFCIESCLSLMVVSQPSMYHSLFGLYLEVNMFLKMGQVFFCIVTFCRRKVSSSYGLTEHRGF
jgi:hypothetical protein